MQPVQIISASGVAHTVVIEVTAVLALGQETAIFP